MYVTLQNQASPNVSKFYVCICLHCSNVHLAQFLITKQSFGKLHNTERLLSDNQ